MPVVTSSEISTIKAINVGIRAHNYRDVMEQENEEQGIRRMERKGCDRRVEENCGLRRKISKWRKCKK